jgi:hypothetical protein
VNAIKTLLAAAALALAFGTGFAGAATHPQPGGIDFSDQVLCDQIEGTDNFRPQDASGPLFSRVGHQVKAGPGN